MITVKEESNVPRPRLQLSSPSLSPGQAGYVLERLVADRRISAGEINRYVAEMHREISTLEARLNSLRSAAGAGGGSAAAEPVRRRPGRPPGSGVKTAAAAGPAAGPQRRRRRGRPPGSGASSSGGEATAAQAAPAATRGRRRRTPITAEQLASRQLQGRYLGLIRQIPASRRGQYQKIAKDQGREAAIREMAKHLGK